jgi:hypothetical protein
VRTNREDNSGNREFASPNRDFRLYLHLVEFLSKLGRGRVVAKSALPPISGVVENRARAIMLIGSIRNIEFKLQWLHYFRQGGVAPTSIRPAIPNSLYRPAGLSSRPRDDSFHDHPHENIAFRIASSDRTSNRHFEYGPR